MGWDPCNDKGMNQTQLWAPGDQSLPVGRDGMDSGDCFKRSLGFRVGGLGFRVQGVGTTVRAICPFD